MPVAVVATTGGSRTSAAPGCLGGRGTPPDDVDGEVHHPAAGALLDQRRGDLEDVAGPDRGLELDVGVGGEQPLVAVEDDAHLGGHVAEQAEAVGAVDEVAGVVGVGVGHVATVGHDGADAGAALMRPSPWLRAGGEAVHDERGDLARRRAAGEDAVDAELAGHRLVEAGATDDQERPLGGRVGLAERGGHLAGVEQVGVALGDDLRDEDGVGLLLAGGLDELRHGDLGAEVHDLELAVVLQALLPREALDVEDRVDADRVRVGADAAADHDQAPAHRALDRGVGLLGRQQRVVALDDLDGAGVDEVVDPAVDDEEGEALPHRLGVHDQRGVHAHLVGELHRGALGDLGVLDGQGEGQLHHAVAGGVAVRADQAHLSPSRISVAGL